MYYGRVFLSQGRETVRKNAKGSAHTGKHGKTDAPCDEPTGGSETANGLRRFRITGAEGFRLADHDPDDTGSGDPEDGPGSGEGMEERVRTLARLQEKLYARGQWGLLVLFQAMDAGGKD